MRNIVLILTFLLLTSFLYAQDTLKERVDKRILSDVTETDTVIIQEKTVQIVKEEVGKYVEEEFTKKIAPPKIGYVKLEIPKMRYPHFFWKDVIIGGSAFMDNGKIVVIPEIGKLFVGEMK